MIINNNAYSIFAIISGFPIALYTSLLIPQAKEIASRNARMLNTNPNHNHLSPNKRTAAFFPMNKDPIPIGNAMEIIILFIL